MDTNYLKNSSGYDKTSFDGKAPVLQRLELWRANSLPLFLSPVSEW